jgi:hypothetical protein
MTRNRASGIVATIAIAVVAAPASAMSQRDAQIRPDVGIGRVRLGMSLAQVRRVLGPPQLLNRRVRVGFGREHREYVWNWFEWTIGFRGTPGRFRAVRVVTSLRRHRYRGIGVGSRVRAVVRVFPRARCRDYLSAGYQLFVRTSRGRELRFVVPPTRSRWNLEPRHIGEVIVQDPLGPHGYPLRTRSSFPPFTEYVNFSYPCPPDWRQG